jgi:hypothetical protein
MSEPEKLNLTEGWDAADLLVPMLEADNPNLDVDEVSAKLNADSEPMVEAIHARIAEFAHGASIEDRIAALEFKVALLRFALKLTSGTLALTIKRRKGRRAANPTERKASAAPSDIESVADERLRSARLRMLGQ